MATRKPKTAVATKRVSSANQADALRAAMARAGAMRRTTSGGNNYISLSKGTTELKVLLDPQGLINFPYKRHRGANVEGKFQSALDLGWLADMTVNGQRELWDYLLEKGKVQEADLARIVEKGDPATRLRVALEQKGMTFEEIKKGKMNPIAQTRVVWNVYSVTEQQAGIMETGPQAAEKFDLLVGRGKHELEDIFGGGPVSWVVEGNGKDGFERRYEYFLEKETALETVPQTKSLVAHAAYGFLTLEEKAEFVLRSYGELAAKAGMTKKKLVG